MRALIVSAVLVGTFGLFAATHAQQNSRGPTRAGDLTRTSALPRPGNLSDVLDCAGANEVFWTTAMKSDPRDPEAHDAKRKAGWYAAVAMSVFQVESTKVIDAVRSAEQARRAEVFALARRCREAPTSWRE